jgi:hypothetical protein
VSGPKQKYENTGTMLKGLLKTAAEIFLEKRINNSLGV